MKQEVIEILTSKELNVANKFSRLMSAYSQHPGKNPAMEYNLNARGASKHTIEHLEYECKKLYNISNADLAVSAPAGTVEEAVKEVSKYASMTVKQLKAELDKEGINYDTKAKKADLIELLEKNDVEMAELVQEAEEAIAAQEEEEEAPAEKKS